MECRETKEEEKWCMKNIESLWIINHSFILVLHRFFIFTSFFVYCFVNDSKIIENTIYPKRYCNSQKGPLCPNEHVFVYVIKQKNKLKGATKIGVTKADSMKKRNIFKHLP